jgi:hypothetical protein
MPDRRFDKAADDLPGSYSERRCPKRPRSSFFAPGRGFFSISKQSGGNQRNLEENGQNQKFLRFSRFFAGNP